MADNNQNLDGWEEIRESNFWSPKNKGEAVEGVIISMETDNFGLKVTVEQSDKKMVVLPSHAVLQSRIKNCKVGEIIKVIFEGQDLPKVKGRNPTNIYKILKKI